MFDANGNLNEGTLTWTVDEVEKNLVAAFLESRSRLPIFQGYLRLRRDLEALNLHGEHWLDGSFTTDKLDPGDIDLVNLIDKDLVDALPPDRQLVLSKLIDGKGTKRTHQCDSYFLPVVPKGHPEYEQIEEMRAYWLNWFGTDRMGNRKGVVSTNFSPAARVSGNA